MKSIKFNKVKNTIIKIPIKKMRRKIKKFFLSFSKKDLRILAVVILGLIVLGVIFLFVEIIAKIIIIR